MGKFFHLSVGFLLLSSALLSGCVSMLTHISLSDENTTRQAKTVGLVVSCMDKRLTDPLVGLPFVTAATDLLSVSVYESKIYEEQYRTTIDDFEPVEPTYLRGECNKVNREAPGVTQLMQSRYQDILRQRRSDLIGMSGVLASSGTQMRPNYSYGSLPSGKVTFGQKEEGSRTRHFLVDTGSGQRQCIVSASGYVKCS